MTRDARSRASHLVRFAVAAILLVGCGGETPGKRGPGGTGGASGDCAPPNRVVGDACREPGVQDDGCPAGTLGLQEGSCQPAGITPEMCAEGFVHDGDVGCEPILPSEPCPPGRMAVPGDAECRPVMPCAPGKWGDLPIDATTEHVDGSYAGGGSDGSAQKPWPTIGAAIDAAAPGAIVAVAAGSYAEDVDIQGKPVVLWGVCPDMVEIVGTGTAAVLIRTQASSTALHGLAITGASHGIVVSGSDQVLLEGVWVHSNAGRGIDIERVLGATSAVVRGSLVEQNHELGVNVSGSEATIEATVVRGTLPDAEGLRGRGVNIQESDGGPASTAIVRGSVVEENHDFGVQVSGSEVTIEATVVRGTLPDAGGLRGRGIHIQDNLASGAASTVTLRGSLIEKNHNVGVHVLSSEVIVEATVVRGTLPNADGLFGRGIQIEVHPPSGAPSTATFRSSLVEQNGEAGVVVVASNAIIEATVVRGTLPNTLGLLGRGIHIQSDSITASAVTVRGSLVEQNHEFGLVAAGFLAVGSDVTVDGCLLRATLPNAYAQFGDGLTAFSEGAPTRLLVGSTRVEDSARAGVSTFGASVSLGSSVVQCASLDLEGEPYEDAGFTFEDLGGDACGCPSADGACLLETVGIEPPAPVTATE